MYTHQMNVIAPFPLKPSSMGKHNSGRMDHCWANFYDKINLDDVQDACMEIQQILQSQSDQHQQQQQQIARAHNPLVQDSSFIPLHQAVSQLQVAPTTATTPEIRRHRSYSVGDHRNMMQQPSTSYCKLIF